MIDKLMARFRRRIGYLEYLDFPIFAQDYKTFVDTLESLTKGFDNICCSAVRYSLGRQTYITGDCAEYIKTNIGVLSDNALNVMLTDITKHEADNELGDENIDAPIWRELKTFITTELEERKNG